MNKTITVLTLALAFLGGFLFFYRGGPIKQVAPVANQVNQQTITKQTWETKTEEQADVTVVVTPIDLSLNSKEWIFDVGMNTHSVELDQDMTKIAILVEDQGKEYKPISWEGPVGGHHREGMLIFNQITPNPKSVELKISNIGDVVRSFVWQL
ncbi:hypothetical protein A2554_00955 [Candidatus Nomurabacteria bacterium RIFOXYD2_FULL_35_12]|uniref:DUF4352 domain-containing protein n=1 Tax=Candidatus Nomurabacteria bacterium RIFOXYA1_FULL_35_17 TaxID=1801798 RepID=A0A1F6YKI3_9BACT|nr:MAG: hypothetical protein A2238_01810 [Candidatus Nomurabacteria bacterium RIFOXYA2_FULL_35_9]OGJ06848.1 MAG: hypothetical protein A2192_02285 [Candidatus Nomurabacteria bacterium RIFOXYA1_FULL_35_17]OGJ13842.1 MAG: hypothetical protein A2554_00955 [Candidatus Nomurabacteria bacterium RIFOXYD2_FULL_35_12]